jgi:hypothetical protein
MTMLWFDRHRRLRVQLSAYIDGALDAAGVERLEAHLAACERCGAEIEELRATVAVLKGLPQAELPRSFVLSAEHAAAGRPPRPAAPLAFGMRIAAAGVAVALAAVLMVDLGDFGGGGAPQEAAAPGITAGRQADEAEVGVQGDAPADDGGAKTPAGDTASQYDAGGDQPEETPAAAGGLAPSPAPTPPPGATAVPPGAEEAPVPGGLTPEPEAGVKQALPRSGGGGGIDALTAAEIGLAAALGVLVTGGLVLAFAGRNR